MTGTRNVLYVCTVRVFVSFPGTRLCVCVWGLRGFEIVERGTVTEMITLYNLGLALFPLNYGFHYSPWHGVASIAAVAVAVEVFTVVAMLETMGYPKKLLGTAKKCVKSPISFFSSVSSPFCTGQSQKEG